MTNPQADTKLLYVHRTLADREIYWVNNRNDRKEILKQISGSVEKCLCYGILKQAKQNLYHTALQMGSPQLHYH